MSHLPAITPDSPSTADSTRYASLDLSQDEAETLKDHSTMPKQDARYVSPRALRSPSRIIGSLVVDFISVLISIALFVFALLGYGARGNTIGSREQKLLDTTRIAATAFPFLFAFIIGRALHGVLSWRLEKGVDCLSLAYLSCGSTLGSTCIAPLRIRCLHWLPAVLIALWAFSPVGSQASLRFIFQKRGVVLTELTDAVNYTYPLPTGGSDCGSCQAPAHNAIFLSSFLSLDMYGPASQDTWGNIKISLVDGSSRADIIHGWRDVPEHASLQYSALIGIPNLRPQGTGNMTFMMQSMYWQLENATLWEKGSQAPLLNASPGLEDSSVLINYTAIGQQWQFAIPQDLDLAKASSIPVTFEVTSSGSAIDNSLNVSYNYNDNVGSRLAVRLEALLTQRPVELNVTCTSSSCNVTAIRNTTSNESYLAEFSHRFLPRLTQAFPVEHSGTPYYGVLEAYLWDPSKNPYNVLSGTDGIDFTHLDAYSLARRLSQILNTYWIVDNQFANAAGGLNPNDPALLGMNAIRNSSVIIMSAQEFLGVRDQWFAFLCISTLTMLFASVASAILIFIRLAPDSTTFLSALTLYDGRSILEGGSYLDEDERVRLLRNSRLMIGDRQADEKIGQIMIGEGGELGALQKERLYW